MSARTIVTIAFGKPYYLELACGLARSFGLWHPQKDIVFRIVTDLPDRLDPDLSWVDVKRVPPGQFNRGFGAKLHLDSFGGPGANLFIDSDCLVFGPLSSVFERWSGRPFAVVGLMVSDGEFFGELRERCAWLGVASVPRFIGSVYYWEDCPLAHDLFARAREMERRYDELGFVRLRGMPNEEPLLSAAFAQAGLKADEDDGTIKADAMAYLQVERCDVTRGRPRLSNPPQLPFPTWLERRSAEPLILHFNDAYSRRPPYLREIARLRWMKRLPRPLAAVASWLQENLPYRIKTLAKDLLRPISHRLFGHRAISASPRT